MAIEKHKQGGRESNTMSRRRVLVRGDVCERSAKPRDVGADPSEDRGLLGVVAAPAGAEAHHAVHVPGPIRVLTVQGTAGVALQRNTEQQHR
ncbi:hypothetical protein EYF80_013226 [Liparis tanakae]|uniref:Uncharacterized protein n=1 Tax=Liparis tanakae TaxID=230148 RepID=A0A4Z2IF51_9TELE|nr:hypothetical protein EYF80_013226 [Liparis tanakae]